LPEVLRDLLHGQKRNPYNYFFFLNAQWTGECNSCLADLPSMVHEIEISRSMLRFSGGLSFVRTPMEKTSIQRHARQMVKPEIFALHKTGSFCFALTTP
jgi:radical SAM superfamily enzyme with C-terminal helix-hairpin-helix motif